MPLWKPSQERLENSDMFEFIKLMNKKNYADLYQWSIAQPEEFWKNTAEFCGLKFSKKPQKILETKSQQMFGAKWFSGAELNFAENLLSRRDDKPALIYCHENGFQESISYKILYQKTALLAQEFKNLGVCIGDRIAGYLSNTPNAVIAMLAAASLGAIWTACSPEYGVDAVIDRFGQILPKILLTQNYYTYQNKIFDNSEKNDFLAQKIASLEKTLNLDDFFINNKANNNININFIQTPFDHPVYILYSSGTTGLPKCIVHSAGGTLLQHLKELKLHTDLKAKDNFFYYTTTSWMMWHWLMSGLSLGATLILYDGSPFYPASEQLFNLIDQEKISIFGVSAKYLSAVQKSHLKPVKTHDLSSLRTILSTGSPLLSEQFEFVYQHIKKDICLSSISGGTDIISCFALGNPVLPVYSGELQCLGLGMKVEVFDASGKPVQNQKGELVCTAPFVSMPVYFWHDKDNQKYYHTYFEKFAGIWHQGDYAKITDHQGLIIYGRSDAVLNPGGIRIGTAEIYREVEKFPEIIESIAVAKGIEDIKIILFVKLKPDQKLTELLIKKIKSHLREHLSPHHVPAYIIQIADIPRTINGKIMEIAVRDMINGQEIKNKNIIKNTMANPEALEYFKNLAFK